MDDQSNLVTPEIAKTKIFTNNQYFEIIKKHEDFSSRTNRKEYWYFILINTIVSVVLSFLWWPLVLSFQILIFFPSLAITTRRLHDVNKDIWYVLIPVYNLILLFKKGTSINSPNYYGSIVDSKIKLKILYILAAILLILSITRLIYAQQQIKKQQQSSVINFPENIEANQEKLEELNNLSLQEIEQAQTLEEVIQAYYNARKGSQASLKGAMKWISFCQTSQEIKEAFNNFPEDSEVRTIALEKWKELSQKELEQAHTIEELKIIHENAPSDDILKSAIYNKWNEISLQKIEQVQTILEAKTVFENSPKGSQAKTKILEKWKELVNQKIDQAQSFEDIKDIYSNSPDDDDLKSYIIIKWIPLCLNTSQAKEVYSNAINREDMALVLEKWKELAKQEIDESQNFQDINYIYDSLPEDNKIKNSAITKWISLCQTYQEAKEVYSRVSSDYSEGKQEALNKWDSLAIKEIEYAQTLEAVKEIYNNTPENSLSRKTALEKIKELS